MANTTTKLRVVYGDGTLGVIGTDVQYIFSYERGGLESLVTNGQEWLYQVPRPALWRATTDNDRGNQFSTKAAMWLGADLFSRCQQMNVAVDGVDLGTPIAPQNNRYSDHEWADQVAVTCTFRTATVPATTITVTYVVTASDGLTVTAHYTGHQNLPELPAFGLRFVMPTAAESFTYRGLSGETYPDRMAGGQGGEHRVVGLPVTPYLVPQEMGMHMKTTKVTVTRTDQLNNAGSLTKPGRLAVEQVTAPFAFSCLPYTPAELENATHIEELPVARRTVLTVFGAVRGVGGIDSWGADVQPDYRISSRVDHEVSIRIHPGR
ncbi:beta-galactosidase small subunit [Furfurilactobacillus sp. WILCCON 0119]